MVQSLSDDRMMPYSVVNAFSDVRDHTSNEPDTQEYYREETQYLPCEVFLPLSMILFLCSAGFIRYTMMGVRI
jgi:hypothetical protein